MNRKSKVLGLFLLFICLFSMFSPVNATTYNKDDWKFTYEVYNSIVATDNAYTLGYLGTTYWYLGGTNTTFIPVTEDVNGINAGFIFNNTNFGRKTEIFHAYLNLTWYNTFSSTESETITIYGIASSDPQTYTSKTNFEARSLTTAYKRHVVSVAPVKDQIWTTIDISDIIQELSDGYIDKYENIEIRILSAAGSFDRSVYSYEGSSAKSVKLYIAHSGCSTYLPTWMALEPVGYWWMFRVNYDDFPVGSPVDYKHWVGATGSGSGTRAYISKDPDSFLLASSPLNKLRLYAWSLPGQTRILKRKFNLTDCDVVGNSLMHGGWEVFPVEDKNEKAYILSGGFSSAPVVIFNTPVPPETREWYWRTGYNDVSFSGVEYLAYGIKSSHAPCLSLIDDSIWYAHFTSWYEGKIDDIFFEPGDYDPDDVDIFEGAMPSPQWSNEGKNNSLVGLNTEFKILWSDIVELDTAIFSTNMTGSWVNNTIPDFGGTESYAFDYEVLPVNATSYFYNWYCNNTMDIWNSTGILSFEISQYPKFIISNSEIDGWVFEGITRYAFEIMYHSQTLDSINQVGFRFTDDINQVHIIWYDRDANTLTVTSPDDGISGWLHSLSQTETNVTAVFHIMFNSPIPDTYDIQASARMVTGVDSGWLNVDGTFSIYNLGGLSTITSSGTAGRIQGGDIFEIYAADTRTRNIIPTQDFDVRYSPLAPGVQIAGVQITEAEDEQKLIDELIGWKIWMTSRTEARTIYPTNRLPATASSGDQSYNSWPFGLLIKSDSTLDQSLMIEKEFFRTIKTADEEIVTAEVWATVANDTKITGQILISDDGYVDDAIKGTWAPGPSDSKRIVDFKFYGNGSIRLMDGASNIYPATYSGMVWANYTFVMNLTAQTYDFYVDSILNRSAIGFREAASSVGHITFLDTLNPVFPAQPVEFYVDDVWVHTDFDADYGGVSTATMLFNQLQHWSMDFDFFVENGQVYAQGASGTPRRVDDDYSDYGYLEFGWDVMLDGSYVNNFLVGRINITDGHISGKNNWVQFNVTWYQNGSYVKNDILYGLFEGHSIFPGNSKDTTGFHWDIWFNRANASTVVGARINTEYYGMSDKSVWWAIWSSKWTPMRSEVSESTVFIDLEDANGTIHSAKDVLFVRSWARVLRNTESQFSYKILNIAGLDFPIARDTMSGIDTPPIRETLIPDVPSGWFGSFLGGIFSAALRRLGNLLMGFGLGLFTMSIDFIDNVFAALGYPGLVSTIFGWMDTLFASVPTLVGFGMTLIGQIYLLINTSAGNTLTQVTNIITIWINMYTITMNLLTGVLTPGINLWNDLGITSFIQIGAVLYPFWLLMYGLENGMQAVIDHVNGMLNLGSFFLNFILNVTGFFISLLTGLIGAIRG